MKKVIVIFLLCIFVQKGYSQIAFIANKGIEMNISIITAVSDIYTLETQKSANGVALVVFDLKTAPNDQFYAALGKSSTELKKIWMKMQLSGDGKAPTALASEDEMIAKVASTPGAIGYVSQAKVTDAVKTLFTIK
jgi:uncharacterized protein (DUF2267 family)